MNTSSTLCNSNVIFKNFTNFKIVYKKLTNPFECLMLKSCEGTKSFRELADFEHSLRLSCQPHENQLKQGCAVAVGPCLAEPRARAKTAHWSSRRAGPGGGVTVQDPQAWGHGIWGNN